MGACFGEALDSTAVIDGNNYGSLHPDEEGRRAVAKAVQGEQTRLTVRMGTCGVRGGLAFGMAEVFDEHCFGKIPHEYQTFILMTLCLSTIYFS